MRDDLFLSPVSVTMEPGAKRQIGSLQEMHEFLGDWPPSRDCDVYRTALRACQAARAGQLTTEQARRAFVAFARMSRILNAELDAAIASAALERMPHRHA